MNDVKTIHYQFGVTARELSKSSLTTDMDQEVEDHLQKIEDTLRGVIRYEKYDEDLSTRYKIQLIVPKSVDETIAEHALSRVLYDLQCKLHL